MLGHIRMRLDAITNPHYSPLQKATVKAGYVFSYTVPITFRMSANKTSLEDKALIIQSEDEVAVFASNKQVWYMISIFMKIILYMVSNN